MFSPRLASHIAGSIALGWCLCCAAPPPAEPVPTAPVPPLPPPPRKAEPEPEPEPEPVPVAEGPVPAPGTMVAVVERGHAWIPQHCDAKEPLSEEASLLPPWGGAALVMLGEGQARSVRPEVPVCFKGECGNHSIGVPVGSDVGILLVADPAVRLEGFELLQVDGDGTYWDERPRPRPNPAPVCASGDQEFCMTWGSAELAVQVRAKGELGEEDEAMSFRESDARILSWREGAWHPGPWSPVPFVDRALSQPLGRTLGPSQTVFWIYQNGMCCPSDSTAWTTTPDAEGRLVMGQKLKGPLGQDCGY